MELPRESGILLHPTSLPGPYGIGEIGDEARRFIDQLGQMGQRLWQVLPLGPTSFGDSPYQALSTFAGNHLLISFNQLVEDGLLDPMRLEMLQEFADDHVEYGDVINRRMVILRAVCRGFNKLAERNLKERFRRFCREESYWLDNYALFIALKDAHGGRPWPDWQHAYAMREPEVLEKATREFAREIHDVKILQFIFHDQWARLRAYAHQRNIRIIGDIPIFVAHDSADVWAAPELFYLDADGRLTQQAGVPPDYFSTTGQLWGNPLYRWDVHKATHYDWWVARLRKIFETVDIVRIDHFRGFEAYWEIAGDARTAIEGRWVKGPGADLFDTLLEQLVELPIIAEDLGVITDEVEALRDAYHLPGMRILQFAFGSDPKAEDYRPHNYPTNCVAYTGTHDNDTTIGWFNSQVGGDSTRSAEEIQRERRMVLDYVGTDGSQINWDMIALAEHSRANTAVIPLQDVMGLGSSARLNTPGAPSGNWTWRFTWDMLKKEDMLRLRNISEVTGRI